MRSLTGRVALVTGATSGHGQAVALELARRGADVVLLGRNPEKCRKVQREIAADCGGKMPEIVLCDLASKVDVERAANEYLASGRPLHILVNNAGLANLKREENVDGLEMTLAVNYLSMFNLTLRLVGRIRESAPARIVNISSDTYKIASIDLDDLQLQKRYTAARAYAQSKLAIVYFTQELARRLEGSGVTVNAVDPGPVASNIGANNEGLLYTLVSPMIRYLFPSAARAARTAVIVATSTDLDGATGGYYRSLKRRERPLKNPDAELARGLWAQSARLTGVDL